MAENNAGKNEVGRVTPLYDVFLEQRMMLGLPTKWTMGLIIICTSFVVFFKTPALVAFPFIIFVIARILTKNDPYALFVWKAWFNQGDYYEPWSVPGWLKSGARPIGFARGWYR